jgi:hypothetical protein
MSYKGEAMRCFEFTEHNLLYFKRKFSDYPTLGVKRLRKSYPGDTLGS